MRTPLNQTSTADDPPPASPYAEYIAQALATSGGHLDIGRGGATLHFGDARLSGCLTEQLKAEATAAGLPVIDSRSVSIELVCDLVIRGPMVAVNRPPDAPPWHALAYAPLAVVADAFREAGAGVFNLEPSSAGGDGSREE